MRSIFLSIVILLISFQAFSQIKPQNDECSKAVYAKLDTLYQQKDILPNLDSIPFCGQQKEYYEVCGMKSMAMTVS
ncbi:MAG: hypothetical protein IPN86_07040 [Saprospiraceae bacterium]|nr:hypothetical protein [Saprospiraceae bacterium]